MQDKFLGEKLHLARVFEGLSQQQLGDAAGVSKQFVQQLENGVKERPSEELEHSLAQVLEVKNDFFYLPPPVSIMEDRCHFRKQKSTPVSVKVQALAHARFFSEVVERLSEVVEFPETDFLQIEKNILTAEDIERAAESCRKKWKLKIDSPIINMVRVLENAGAIVTEFSEISEKVDAFSIELRRPLLIRNTIKESACRARFDMAHELGHLVLHSGQETGSDETERQAHRFASAFLLPRVAFLNEASFLKFSNVISWKKLLQLKLRWKVSLAAILRRAFDLRLIDAIQFRKANIQLRKSGQARVEEFDSRIENDLPEVLGNAIRLVGDDDPGSLLRIRNGLGIEWTFFKKIIGQSAETLNFEKWFDESKLIAYPAR